VIPHEVKLLELTRSIKEHAEIMQRFLVDGEFDSANVGLELFGRCNLIEARIAQIRGTLSESDSGRPDNVHVLGERGDDAA
jgi:hypothetical protein